MSQMFTQMNIKGSGEILQNHPYWTLLSNVHGELFLLDPPVLFRDKNVLHSFVTLLLGREGSRRLPDHSHEAFVSIFSGPH